MTERKAVHYGQVELIPGIICDGYVLDNGQAVLSERGVTDLLALKPTSQTSLIFHLVPSMASLAITRAKSNRYSLILQPFELLVLPHHV